MKQKVVIKVAMNDEKYRQKALKAVVDCMGGVLESTAIQGENKDQIVVIGVGIDAVQITTLLRKKIGHSEIVSVSPVGDEKDGSKVDEDSIPSVVWAPHLRMYEYEVPNSSNNLCTIL